jgi:DNA-binding transcriptional LysR family regulator
MIAQAGPSPGASVSFTLDQLKVLDAVARTGTFAGASKELHRVPSAISYAMRTLEEGLELPLIDRSGHRAGLTAEGHRVLEAARGLLQRSAALEVLAAELRGGWEPVLQVVVDGAFPLGPIIAAMHAFSQRELPTRVQLQVEYLGGVGARFRQRKADLMLALEPPSNPALTAVDLAGLDLVLVAAAEHPLAAAITLSRDDLARHVELVVADSDPSHDGSPYRLALGSPAVFRLSDFLSKRIALLGGVGYGWLPMPLAARNLAAGRLVELPLLEGSRVSYAPQLLYRRRALGRAGHLFVQLLLKEFDRALAAAEGGPPS